MITDMGVPSKPYIPCPNYMNHRVIIDELSEIKEQLEAEGAARGGFYGWIEMFQGPRGLSYRIVLGVSLQTFQQLTGASHFFYYDTYTEGTTKKDAMVPYNREP